MLSDRVMDRLGQLTRAAPAGGSKHQELRGSRAQVLRGADLPPAPAPASSLPGREVETPLGNHWLVEQPVAQLWPAGPGRLERHADSRRAGTPRDWDHPQLGQLSEQLPRDVLLLDLETCGFAGSMVFLIGALYQRDGQLWLSQWLARNYAEERAILHSLWEVVPRKPLLVTFNGKSFDWPVIRDRTTLHRLVETLPLAANVVETAYSQPQQHCDVLHHARRRWKGRLPNCRLQTLERHVCGRRREGDIAGRLIPDTYHHFVRSGETSRMRAILHHNALDLVTLLQLSLVLA
jgi:uncharacterized protein YprB with RNaseH-like and TPR domain